MRAIIDGDGLKRIGHWEDPLEFGDATNGCAIFKVNGAALRIVFSDGEGWEHVSVSLPTRCPSWDEMCAVKNRFFYPEECVIQYHPPQSVYRNAHPFCLHLWRPMNEPLPMPDPYLVAPSAERI